jgi:HD-GYP domain-containing protein (c-di-GMP phosphodiesterase class II)
MGRMVDPHPFYPHQDRLGLLDGNQPLQEQLRVIHAAIHASFPFVTRVAVAIYDEHTGHLSTYLSAGTHAETLERYNAPLDDAPALSELLRQGRPRVVNDMEVFSAGTREHTRWTGARFQASYTMAAQAHGSLLGFVFFNASRKNAFTPEVLGALDVYGHLVAAVVNQYLMVVRTLSSVVRIIQEMVHQRDPETGAHLERMARYSRLIAQDLAARGSHRLNDEWIEHLFLFAPLHDVGKIAIPDRVLMKPGGLNPEERQLMETHAARGRDILGRAVHHLRLDNLPAAGVLTNIAGFHHEKVNGTGYPDGLVGSHIPLEARVVAVADVYDALTSVRPYKAAWPHEQAAATLRRMAGESLDVECVESLLRQEDKVAHIRREFADPVVP